MKLVTGSPNLMWLHTTSSYFNINKILVARRLINISWGWISVFFYYYYYFLVGYSVAGLDGLVGVGLCCMCVFIAHVWRTLFALLPHHGCQMHFVSISGVVKASDDVY
jgi:hypothetical protein